MDEDELAETNDESPRAPELDRWARWVVGLWPVVRVALQATGLIARAHNDDGLSVAAQAVVLAGDAAVHRLRA